MKLCFRKGLRLLLLVGCICCAAGLKAASKEELLVLEAEMLNFIDTDDREAFSRTSEELKAASKEMGDERMFFWAWSHQGIYEATHQDYGKAFDIAKQIMDYARENGSKYGEYTAMHTRAMALLQQHNYDLAQKAFLEAVDYHHRHFPKESSAEDLRELMKIAYNHGNLAMAKKYGKQLLAEPNVTPHHKGRTLYRLCQIAFEENNVEEFNRIYEEMRKLTQTSGVKEINLFTEVNYYIINGDYKQALLLVDRLSPDSCAERKAIIYHRLGDNEKAYEYMVQYVHISDSLEHISRAQEVGSLYLRMNNDRLRLERELLGQVNNELRYRFYFVVGILLILVLLFIIYQRHRIIKILKQDKTQLEFEKTGVERSLEDLNELSFYESKTSLPLTMTVKINLLCDYLAGLTQKHCRSGVITIFQTELSDDFVIKTNPKALEKLLTLLLNDSSRFTRKGLIILKCVESGEYVNFCITDSSLEHDKDPMSQLIDLFGEVDHRERYASSSINICQSISRLLHGRFWLDAEYKEGARFFFVIPKQPELR